jgi:hypothetical protein
MNCQLLVVSDFAMADSLPPLTQISSEEMSDIGLIQESGHWVVSTDDTDPFLVSGVICPQQSECSSVGLMSMNGTPLVSSTKECADENAECTFSFNDQIVSISKKKKLKRFEGGALFSARVLFTSGTNTVQFDAILYDLD